MKYLLPILALSLLAVFSCKKEEDPEAPVIEFEGISAVEVTQFDTTLTITFTYEDFQGDLGEEDPDDYSLRIKDDRLANYDWYHIPPMTPDLQSLHIKGTYSVQIASLFLLGSGGQETTRFTLQLRDRAGNWSNSIITPTVTILP